MEPIIDPVPKELLIAELTPSKLLRSTNKAGNKIYLVDYADSPNVLREVGRLREIAFRDGGGGTGKALDLDRFDTDPSLGYKQLVLWDPDAEAIIGGYRFVLGSDVIRDVKGQPMMPSAHLFRFSHYFISRFLPYTIELSRSFVSPDYQSTRNASKSLYALDNLFDGLGALIKLYGSRMKYFFGKMTIYPSFPREGLNMLLFFLKKHFGRKKDLLVIPKNKIEITDEARMEVMFYERQFKDDYRILKAEIHKLGVNIPPLVNSYMNLSPKMRSFGAAVNDEFGDVIEAGILIKFDDLLPDKVERHVNGFRLPNFLKFFRSRKKAFVREETDQW